MTKYQTVHSMAKDLSDKWFYIRFLLKDIQNVFRHKQYGSNLVKHASNRYQENFRFYLDEYPEQELLRASWFQKRDNEYFMRDIISYGEKKTETVNNNLFKRFTKRM